MNRELMLFGYHPPKHTLHEAARLGQLAWLKNNPPERAQVNAWNAQGKTALFLAAQNGHTKVVSFLLHCGAEPQKDNRHTGDTPLHAAVQRGAFQIVKNLIEYGAEPKQKNQKRRSAWGLCCRANKDNLVSEMNKWVDMYSVPPKSALKVE